MNPNPNHIVNWLQKYLDYEEHYLYGHGFFLFLWKPGEKNRVCCMPKFSSSWEIKALQTN